MRVSQKDALICDFAQFYHIYDIDSLHPQYAAILACGLPEDSRIMRERRESVAEPDSLLLATIVDELNMIIWILGNGKGNGIPLPESIFEKISGISVGTKDGNTKFESGYDFEREWQALTGE